MPILTVSNSSSGSIYKGDIYTGEFMFNTYTDFTLIQIEATEKFRLYYVQISADATGTMKIYSGATDPVYVEINVGNNGHGILDLKGHYIDFKDGEDIKMIDSPASTSSTNATYLIIGEIVSI